MAGPAVIELDLLRDPLARAGWELVPVQWDEDPTPAGFDAALVRATWDYHLRPGRFLERLEAWESAVPVLANPLDLIRWNADKRYLLELAEAGIPVVPSEVSHGLDGLEACFGRWGSPRLVVKPVVGASAYKTFLLEAGDSAQEARSALAGQTCLIQPFMEAVVVRGEWSLIYFDGVISHAILKRPGKDDFRVQEELGGSTVAAIPGKDLMVTGQHVLSALPTRPLFARLDLIEDIAGVLVMEVEVIEPVLFLDLAAGAPQRMARAIVNWARRPKWNGLGQTR